MIGDAIKDFTLSARIGRGGMGEVYAAKHRLLGTSVAIKLLREEISADQLHVQRFFNEAIAASKIKHAGIAKIFDAGFHGGRAYLVMELLEGEALSARVKRTPRPSIDEIVEISAQLASVLEATHAVGIIHRDLKPDNAFLVADAEQPSGRRVKVLDFGIAKLGDAPVGEAATALTASNSSMGTPAYMAPEQWSDAASAGTPADVYSLGCIVFELCTSRPPFVATSMAEACNQHLHSVPPRVRALAPEVPAELDALIARMLAKAAADRPTMAEVAAALAPLRTRTPTLREALAETAAPAAVDALPATAPSSIRAAGTAPAQHVAPNDSLPAANRSHRRGMLVVGSLVAASAIVGTTYMLARRTPPATPVTRDGVTNVMPPPSAPLPAPAFTCPDGMVPVPAGTFMMGSMLDDERHSAPRHRVTLRAFCIDRTEVTIAAYQACVTSGGCKPAGNDVIKADFPADKLALWSRFCDGMRTDRPTHPVNCVDWAQASAYCTAVGKRLPTEAEWEYAARGTDGRTFPWGNEPPDHTRLDACDKRCKQLASSLGQQWQTLFDTDDGYETTAPVGSFPAGASPFGVLDMAGNVSEWIADWYGPYPDAAQTDPAGPASGPGRVVRFNDWESLFLRHTRSTWRAYELPEHRTSYIGFRCAGQPR